MPPVQAPGRPHGASTPQLPQLEKRPRTTSHAAPPPMFASQGRRGMKGNATLSTGLMQARASGNVTHALPTTPGLSKHFDLDGLRAGTSSPSLLRPLLSSVAHWQDDDKALYGGAHYSWNSGYDSELEYSPAKRQQTVPPSRENGARWGLESDTRFGWPTRSGAGSPMQPSVRRFELDEDWDGSILQREFQAKVAQARRGSSNPEFRFEPAEGGLGGDAASAASSPREFAPGLDLESVTTKVEKVIADRTGPRPFPADLKGKHQYFLETSDSVWPRLGDDTSSKNMPFDLVEEVQVYTDMLERAIGMVEGRIPGCGAVLRKSFQWFVQVPVDKVMLARRDYWRRPHRDAFQELEDKVENLASDARNAQNAAINAEQISREALTQVKESSEKEKAAVKAHRSIEVELRTTQKSAATRLEEATVAKAYSNKQSENIVALRTDYEKTLRELAREERLRTTADASNARLTARVEDLEAQVNDYIRQLKGTRAAKRAKKIERRAKIVTSELQEIERKARSFSAVVNQEGARLNNGLGLTHNLDRSMKDAQQGDRALAEKPAYLGGGATIKGETETLVKYASASAEFAEQAVEAVQDSSTCIGNLDKMVAGFNMADQLPDSDSDGETAEIEQLKKDNDLLREKQFNNEQVGAAKDRELIMRQESIDHLKTSLRQYTDWQKRVENEVTKIKEDFDRKLRAKEEEMEKIMAMMQEMKLREQEFKDQIRALEKDVAAKDKEISQFESKLAQFKNKVESLTKENETKAQKIGKLEHEIVEFKAEVQALKEESRALQSQIKELNARVHDLEVELAVERDTVAKLRNDVQEYKRQIALHEERAREHAAELKKVKDDAARAAEEAKRREQTLLREKKEIEDKMAQMQREFKAQIAELEKQRAQAVKRAEAAEARLKEVQEQLDEVNEKFRKSAAEISKWKEMALKASDQVEVFRSQAKDAEKKLKEAAHFADDFDKFQAEMERMKEFERMYQRAMRECEELKQELEFLKSNKGAGEDDAEEPDDELLVGMETKARHKGGKGAKKKGKTFALPNNSGVLGPWVKPKESSQSKVREQTEVASKIMLARMLSKMLEPDDQSGDVSIADKIEGFVRIADEHLHQTAGGMQSMREAEVQEALQEMGYDQKVVKQAMAVVAEKRSKVGTNARKQHSNQAAGGVPSAAMMHKREQLDGRGQSPVEAGVSDAAPRSPQQITLATTHASTGTVNVTTTSTGTVVTSATMTNEKVTLADRRAVELGQSTVAIGADSSAMPRSPGATSAHAVTNTKGPNTKVMLADRRAVELGQSTVAIGADSSAMPRSPGATSALAVTHTKGPITKVTAAQRRAAELEQKMEEIEATMLDKRAVTEVLATAQALSDWNKIDAGGEGSTSNDKVIEMLEDKGFTAAECEEFIHRVDPKQSGFIAQEVWLDERSKQLSTTVEVQRTFSVSVAGSVVGQPHVTKQKLKPKADGEFANELLMNRMLHKMGVPSEADESIPARIAEFQRAADQQFKSAAEDGRVDGETAEEVMTHLGLRKDIVQEALTKVTKEKGTWLDRNGFAHALSTAQSLSAWHKIDFERKGSVATKNVGDFLEDCGYAPGECEEILHRIDPEKNGVVSQHNWVSEWNKHLGTALEVHTSIPATAVAHVSGVAVSSTKIAGRLTDTFRHATKNLRQAARATVSFSRARPQAGTQTSDVEAMGRDPRDPSIPGGGQTLLQPTPMGRLLELKDQEIARAEANYEAAVDQIAQLLGFIKARTEHHELQVENLRAEIDLLRDRSHVFPVTLRASTPKIEQGPQVGEPAQIQSGVSVSPPVSEQLTEQSSSMEGEHFPAFSQMYKDKSELSVQVGRARTKVLDLKEFHRGSAAPAAPRSILWLTKILHGIVASKMVCDAVDASMDLPMSSWAAFCADWMRNRFGVDGLVKKACQELDSSLSHHRNNSLLVELIADFFDGKHSSAEQRAFLHCYSLVSDHMDRQRLPRESPYPREIPLSTAIDILNRVLPYAAVLHRQSFKDRLLEAALDDPGADVSSADLDEIAVDDHQLFDIVVKERMRVQHVFHDKIMQRFQRHDPGRGLLSYDDVSRLLQDLVPWNDTRQLHATIGNVCPDLLAPGAVIDITNLLILDERIDFLGSRVNGLKVKES